MHMSTSRLAAERHVTYIDNLGIVRLPAFYEAPGIVLLVPNLETMVRAGRDHARAKVVEVDSKHKILVAMGEGLQCGHICIDATRAYKVRLELLDDAPLNDAWAAVGAGLLDQRGDQIDVLEYIFKCDGEAEMGKAVMGERARMQASLVAGGAEGRRIANGRRGQARGRYFV